MERRTLLSSLAIISGLSIIAGGTMFGPAVAKTKAKPIYKTSIKTSKETVQLSIYKATQKESYVAVVHGKGRAKWYQMTVPEKTAKSAFVTKDNWKLGDQRFTVIQDSRGVTINPPNGQPTAQAEPVSAGAAAALAPVIVIVVVAVGIYYFFGDDISEKFNELNDALEGSTTSGVWDDGSEECSQGRIPDLLC